MRTSDLARQLAAAAQAMPARERRKFKAVLGGALSTPRDGLPAITTHRPTRKPRRRAYHQIAPAQQLRLI